MLPGDGFISNPESTALARAEYVCIRSEKRWASLVRHAAIDEVLLHSVQLGKLGEQSPAADLREQIGGVAEGGIGGDATEPVRAAAFESYRQCRQRRSCALSLVCGLERRQRSRRGRRPSASISRPDFC